MQEVCLSATVPHAAPGVVFEFGDFRLDCGRFELLRHGKALRVERKPLELLILLVSRQGQLVTRGEIAQRLWSSEVFVDTEHGINTAIRKLRYLLRDDSEGPKFIQTVTGKGYRFLAPVSTVEEAGPPEPVESTSSTVPVNLPQAKRSKLGWYLGAGFCALLALGGTGIYRLRHRAPEISYTQLTDFTDSAVQPALSPDGHMLAFIRGSDTFMTSDQIYVKMLPNGEPRRVTDDQRVKYGLTFSPDGSEIAYTVLEGPMFSTYEVSALGGEPRLLMKNAAGLVWLNPQKLLFSAAPSGIHLSVVTETITGEDRRAIYSPKHERGMAHYSFPSPDKRWALVVEMDESGGWSPCRLVGLAGQQPAQAVGPAGGCTSAGWSTDGRWMYFTAVAKGQSHVWEERFPEGEPEQLTFGPTEENGIAVEPDGHALITSAGVHESAIWIHDERGERSLSSEGEVLGWPFPVFSADDREIYYLLRRWESSGAELWRTTVETGRSEAVFPGIAMTDFDISPDAKQVVYTTRGAEGSTELWVAAMDRSAPPAKVNILGAHSPRFGGRGQILFQRAEGAANYLEQIDLDGSHLSKTFPFPILDFQNVSPGRKWVLADLPKTQGSSTPALMAIPLDGGRPRRVCAGYCTPAWSTDGRFLFVPVELASRTSAGRSLAIPLGAGEELPEFPVGGIALMANAREISGAVSVGRAEFVPGKNPDEYVWVNTTVHRNLYRLTLP
jgi:DNA-binding winged helix-turn-helix (wHTH) protein